MQELIREGAPSIAKRSQLFDSWLHIWMQILIYSAILPYRNVNLGTKNKKQIDITWSLTLCQVIQKYLSFTIDYPGRVYFLSLFFCFQINSALALLDAACWFFSRGSFVSDGCARSCQNIWMERKPLVLQSSKCFCSQHLGMGTFKVGWSPELSDHNTQQILRLNYQIATVCIYGSRDNTRPWW